MPRKTSDIRGGAAGAESERGAGLDVDPGASSKTAAERGARIWSQVVESVRGDGRMQEVSHWASRVSPVRCEGGTLIVAAPSVFVRDRILHGQPDALLEFSRLADPEILSIEVVVDPSLRAPTAPKRSTQVQPRWPTTFFDSPCARPRMRFERFVTGTGNAEAFRTAVHLAEGQEPKYSSIFVHGEIGTGKTHIRHAVAHRFLECHAGRDVLSATAEEFSAEYGRACKESLGQAFRDRCAQIDLLVIDDLQQLGGRPGTQRQLLAMLDLLLESGRRVAAFSDRRLRAHTDIDPRIITRLSGGPASKLERPDPETRFAILTDLSVHLGGGQYGIIWHDEALQYISEQASPDCRDLEGCVLQILSAVEPLHLEVTRERAEHVLQHRFLVLRRRITVAEVRKRVGKHFGVDERALASRSRSSDVVLARQVAMYVARRVTGYSLSAIGAEFGGRDHSTVSYAIRRVSLACESDLAFDAEVRELIRSLEAS